MPRAQRSKDALLEENERLRARLDRREGERDTFRKRQAYYQALIAAIPDPFFIIDRHGTFVDFMPAAGFKTLIPPAEFLGRKITDVMPERTGRECMARVERALRTDRTQIMEYSLRLDGESRHFEARISPSGRQEVVAVVRDITARKEVIDELIMQASILENMVEGVSVSDAAGVIFFTNSAFDAMYGYPRGQLIGQQVSVLEAGAPGEPGVRERLDSGQGWSGECRARKKDGTSFWTETRISPLDLGGRACRITVQLDITGRRRAAEERQALEAQMQQAQKLESLGVLAAGIAHEINNPVGAILLAARTTLALKDRPEDSRHVEALLETVVRNANRCGKIVKSVLQFSRREPTDKWSSDLNMVVERAVNLTRLYASQRGATILVDLAEGLPRVNLNPIGIEQVVVNLVRNAVESRDGALRIDVRTEPCAEGVCLKVRDNGRGLTPEQMNHLFDPFYTTRQSQGGSGLGLSVTHGIVSEHAGQIGVSSQPNQGTEISVVLPREQAGARSGDGASPDR